jgi:hypothetical protein
MIQPSIHHARPIHDYFINFAWKAGLPALESQSRQGDLRKN